MTMSLPCRREAYYSCRARMRHRFCTVIIPYDKDEDAIVPVTVHAITRQQIGLRFKSGRFQNEQYSNGLLRKPGYFTSFYI